MYCPVCGQQQVSEETRFCSRCGFLLSGIEKVIENEGNLPYLMMSAADSGLTTPRKKGLKQGLMIFLLTFLIVPLVVVTSVELRFGPFATVITAILLAVGGLLRMAYALLMESNDPTGKTLEQNLLSIAKNLTGKSTKPAALPLQNSIPTTFYSQPTGKWRETNDLVAPPSVTDETTKLLQKES